MADFNGVKDGNTIYSCKDSTARTSISTIEGKIPSSASSSNKLATASEIPVFSVTDETLIINTGS